MYIILDDVQFLRQGWHHRDMIKTANGAEWLTVPVCKKGRYDQLIRDVLIDNSTRWREAHLNKLTFNYKKAPDFERCFSEISDIYNRKHTYLMDLNMDLLRYIAAELDVRTPVVLASQFNATSRGSERLIYLVRSVRGAGYLTGMGSKDYLDEKLFKKAGIQVLWHEYEHPVYDQLFGQFVPRLSAIDYLMMRSCARSVSAHGYVNS